jgi:hypothetical protein
MAEGRQQQDSNQSGANPSGDKPQGSGKPDEESRTGIGSTAEQDRGKPPKEKGADERSSGTADIERGTDYPGNSPDSLVNDPVGAFKERP